LVYEYSLKHAADAYADPEDQKRPYVSPDYGDYAHGFPPTLIQVGTTEIFLSNAIRHDQTLADAGVPVKSDPYEGMWHVFQAFTGYPRVLSCTRENGSVPTAGAWVVKNATSAGHRV